MSRPTVFRPIAFRPVVFRPAVFGVALAASLAALAFAPPAARATDTVETFDVGATDFEFYTSVEGLGLAAAEDRAFGGELVLGYGIVERLSAFLGTSLTGDGHLTGGAASPYVGVFGTPVDTDHVDFDLFLQVGLDGEQLHIGPSLELNFDADPDQLSWGLYLRSGLDIAGADEGGGSGFGDLAWAMEATVGAYWTVHEGHQILAELDTAIPLHPRDESRPVDLGGVAIGYNVAVHDSIELVSQVWLDLPQEDGEPISAAFLVGFIASLP